MSQVLDQIHTSASQSDTLTTFNEFAPPPSASVNVEAKGLADELIQNGISGLYSRFKDAVAGGKDRQNSMLVKENTEGEVSSVKSPAASTMSNHRVSDFVTSRASLASLSSPMMQGTPASRLQSPTASYFTMQPSPGLEASQQGFKSSIGSTQSVPKTSASRPQVHSLSKSTTSAVVPTVATVTVTAFRENDSARSGYNGSPATVDGPGKKSPFPAHESPRDRRHSFRSDLSEVSPTVVSFPERYRSNARVVSKSGTEQFGKDVERDGRAHHISANTAMSVKGAQDRVDADIDLPRVSEPQLNVDGPDESQTKTFSAVTATQPSFSAMAHSGSEAASVPSRKLPVPKRSAAVERLSQANLPGYRLSNTSSTDRSTAEYSPITTSAHNSVRHESFSMDDDHSSMFPGLSRIPGTTTSGGTQAVSNRLEQMRRQVLSKEYWMKDETCKECFLCGNSFSAFRRKHHCRTCGCIFDSKCTSITPGDRFGVDGSLRVCKTCLDIINRRHESSGSDDSADDATPIFREQLGNDNAHQIQETLIRKQSTDVKSAEWDNTGQSATPMMAIPATRRTGDATSSRSAVLEIDAPQIPRPNSSRSLKSLSGRPSSAHRRMHSKHNFLGRFKATTEQTAPFRRDATAEMGKRRKLPAFHDDNVIDPDIAQYLSDDGSSEDEPVSIFATMNGGGGAGNGASTSGLDAEPSGFGSLLSTGKRHRMRPDKSLSGISFTSRGVDDGSTSGVMGHVRTGRRRNMSIASNHHNRGSPRSNRMSGLMKGIGSLGEDPITSRDIGSNPLISAVGPTRMTRSASMRDGKFPPIELSPVMLRHVENMLSQLLEKEDVSNARLWEKALLPILLRCVDDVCMNIRRGDEIDIRHYVKLKKVPGGRPCDTSYVSGVVFTKKLALKSMPRSIPNPRIVVVSFPIEYSRHRDNFMSLEPIIAQEQEFLRNMVNRIASMRPSLLIVQKNVSGLALQYLAEANITVISNIKQSVIEAVSRCAETVIISSIDMVTLRPVHVGKSAGFDVKTYVSKDIPGKKKTLIYISGCAKELGCTIVLRGASIDVLAKMKRIAEFMAYVTYNLMLETSLFRDEFVSIPSMDDSIGSLPPSSKQEAQTTTSGPVHDSTTRENDKLRKSNESDASFEPKETDGSPNSSDRPKIVSAHESHVHDSSGSHVDQVPEDVPMPTFYSDLVAKHQTKILSASPFVKFTQPYLLVKVREQERRLMYLKRLRDQDSFEEQADDEKSKPQRFQLIKPAMIHETVKGAPKQIMEVLHAVHDAEYDKALHNYQTHQRQWESSIQGNVDLFDPYHHQNLVVLYTVVCTSTTIPCAGPEVLALEFYNEHLREATFDPDCTLGQWVEDLCLSADSTCTFSGCDRKMTEHHRTYVHGEARITVFLEKMPCKLKGLQDSILMWSYCKFCKKETSVMPMSDSTWKYSFGKYLELSFWSSGLRLRAGFCPHDFHREHIRFFGYKNIAVRIHYDPIDLLEIVVPRSRITWKVESDLNLKNELFTKIEERWIRFMTSVKSRIKGINVDSVAAGKSAACKAEVEKLTKRANDEQESMIKELQDKYMESKYYEVIPLNRAIRAMHEKVVQWDAFFADFETNFFPSERDIRRLAALQLKRYFMDRDESSSSLVSNDPGDIQSDADEKAAAAALDSTSHPPDIAEGDADNELASVPDENTTGGDESLEGRYSASPLPSDDQPEAEQEKVLPLDFATQESTSSPSHLQPDELPGQGETTRSTSPMDSCETLTSAADTGTTIRPEDSDATIVPTRYSTVDGTGSKDSSVSAPPALATGIPRPTDRKVSRRLGTTVPPPVTRTHSAQPMGTLRRAHVPGGLTQRTEHPPHNDPFHASHDTMSDNLRNSAQDPFKGSDRKVADRFGMAMKNPRKVGHSLIPRSVQHRRQDSKVSALAKHFDQLSREFEKERMKDRKNRAATVTQSRGFPQASSRPIVEVYRNVNDAVEERGPSDDDLMQVGLTQSNEGVVAPNDGSAGLNQESTDETTRATSPTGTTATAETVTDASDQQAIASQYHSDEECTASDAENSLLDDLPELTDIANSLEDRENVAGEELNLDLPKHEKNTVMKFLTNFWAERSASGWSPLEYLIHPSEHVFGDVDVIIREDEPSSLIAFSLATNDYKMMLQSVRQQGQDRNNKVLTMEHEKYFSPDFGQDSVDQVDVETSLHNATGTHLIMRFEHGSAKFLCKIFYAEQFDALRRKCGVNDRIVESLSRCVKWKSQGGKTNSAFLKTLDDRLVLKSLSPIETQAFIKFAPAYFNLMAEALFHELPTAIAKMLGFFSIVIKNPATGTDIKWDVLLMENLFYGHSPNRIFDLKGSMRNRKIQSTGEQNEVLLDENMVDFIFESPLFAREHSKRVLRSSVWNDTLFLARQNVMDYSLMVAVDGETNELVVGIIDCIRTFTWDKKLESWIKDKGFVGGGRNKPTVTSPKEYKSRFREAMSRYVLEAPSCWHQFSHFKQDQQRLYMRKPVFRLDETGDTERKDG